MGRFSHSSLFFMVFFSGFHFKSIWSTNYMKSYGFLVIIISTVILSSMACVYFIFGDIHFTITNRNDFTQQQSTLFDFVLIYLVISIAPSVFVARLIWGLFLNEKKQSNPLFRHFSIILYVFYWLLLIYLFCVSALELDPKEITYTLLNNRLKLLLFLLIGVTINYSLLSFNEKNSL